MSAAIVNLMKISPKSIIASNRIAQFLCQVTGYPLVDDKKLCSKFDELIIVNGPMLYCNFREELKKMCESAKRIIWVCNDYAIPAPGFIKERAVFWSACDQMKGQENRYIYTNWNQLTHIKGYPRSKPIWPGLCYYGAFREGRAADFEKYFGTDLYDLNISSSKTGEAKFRKIAPKARYFSATNLLGALSQHECVLYIEDKKSHNFYTSPANRFYEAVSAGVPQFFDIQCMETFARAGIEIDPSWVVHDPQSVKKAIGQLSEIGDAQRRAFSDDYAGKLATQVKTALKSIPSFF